MKVLVISLERANDRRKYIYNHLKELELDFEIVDAIDYKKLTESDFNTLCDLKASEKNPCITKGVYACALSHAKVLRKIVDENYQTAFIIEDDAKLPKNIKSLLDDIDHEIKNKEIISLSYYSHSKNELNLSSREVKKLTHKYQLFSPVKINDVASTMAYVITKNAAQAILDIIYPISAASDYWGVFYSKNSFESFRCVYPVPVMPASFNTLIDYQNSSLFKTKLASIIRKYKIPLLFNYIENRSKQLVNSKHKYIFSQELPFNKLM